MEQNVFLLPYNFLTLSCSPFQIYWASSWAVANIARVSAHNISRFFRFFYNRLRSLVFLVQQPTKAQTDFPRENQRQRERKRENEEKPHGKGKRKVLCSSDNGHHTRHTSSRAANFTAKNLAHFSLFSYAMQCRRFCRWIWQWNNQ